MTTNLLDWDEELERNPEEEYQALLRALRRTEGFGLLFVECSVDKGEQIIQRVRQDLTAKAIDTLKFTEAIEDGNVYQRIRQTLAKNPVNILFIQGLEHSLLDYEDTKRHLGWSEEDIQPHSWRDVPRIMLNLNQQRENFRDSFSACLVFLVPQFVVKYLIHRAPDFFDWRSGSFEFPRDDNQLDEDILRLCFGDERFDANQQLSHQQRAAKIIELQVLLDELRPTAEEKTVDLLYEQSLLFYLQNEYEEAVTCCRRSLEITPQERKVWFWQGVLLGALGRYEEAIASYDKAIEFKPDDHEVWWGRGISLAALGRYEEAIASYDKAIEFKPDHGFAWYNKVCCFSLMKQFDQSLELLEKAIQLDAKYREMAKTDEDFAALREDGRFWEIVGE
ncbi:MAG: tetratricopeptide repeat protein [Leptolyngbyaceae bacterium]|nr:tetratricopeptide repeat protein [Leptolyngbyaceae bacterium]